MSLEVVLVFKASLARTRVGKGLVDVRLETSTKSMLSFEISIFFSGGNGLRSST